MRRGITGAFIGTAIEINAPLPHQARVACECKVEGESEVWKLRCCCFRFRFTVIHGLEFREFGSLSFQCYSHYSQIWQHSWVISGRRGISYWLLVGSKGI